jgi:hypothetical protein
MSDHVCLFFLLFFLHACVCMCVCVWCHGVLCVAVGGGGGGEEEGFAEAAIEYKRMAREANPHSGPGSKFDF